MDVGPRSANDVDLCQNEFWQCNFLRTKDMLKLCISLCCNFTMCCACALVRFRHNNSWLGLGTCVNMLPVLVNTNTAGGFAMSR